MNDIAQQALARLDDAIRAYAKLITADDDTVTTGWVLTLAAIDPVRGEVVTTDRAPGQTYITTRGLMSVAEQYWRGR